APVLPPVGWRSHIYSSGGRRMNTKNRAIYLTVAAVMSLSACSFIGGRGGSSSPMYQITANREIYSRGNTGEVIIRNTSSRQLEYNLCPRRLERQANKYWVVAFAWPNPGGAFTTSIARH